MPVSGLWHSAPQLASPEVSAPNARVVCGGRYSIQQLLTDTSGTGFTFRNLLQRPAFSGFGLKFRYDNPGYNGGAGIKIASAYEDANGIWPMTFGGKYVTEIDIGGYVWSDTVDVPIVAGQVMWERPFAQALASGGQYGLNVGQSQTGEGINAGGDNSQSGAITASTGLAFGATAVMAVPLAGLAPVPVVGYSGDSIAAGSVDTALAGWVTRALNGAPFQSGVPAAPIIKVALGGEGFEGMSYPGPNPIARNRFSLLQLCTHVFEQYGINDINGGSMSLAALQAGLIADLWLPLYQRGIRVIRETVLPSTASTGPQEAVRVAFDSWLRIGAPLAPGSLAPQSAVQVNSLLVGRPGHPLFAVFDGCPAVETAPNSGVQIGGMFSDGTHPNAAGHTAIAALLNPATYLS
jgi:hypothetical protein